jgi:hypothetical protein
MTMNYGFKNQVAQTILGFWLSTWDAYKESKNKALHQGALYAKARGLVGHDRYLNDLNTISREPKEKYPPIINVCVASVGGGSMADALASIYNPKVRRYY